MTPRSNARALARSSALVQLVHNHPAQFQELYRALVESEDVPPVAFGFERHKALNRLRSQARRDLANLEEHRDEFAKLFQTELMARDLAAPRPRRNAAECGTPGGHLRHLRQNEESCTECKAAEAERAHQYYLDTAEDRAARMAAFKALTADEPDRFELLLAEERANAGVADLTGRPRRLATAKVRRRTRRRVMQEWPEYGRYLARERKRRGLR